MAWVRCCGGKTKKVLLAPLSSLARSTNKWTKNSYYISVNPLDGGTSNVGRWNSATSDTANITTNDGYSPAIVTMCESDKTYYLKTGFSGTSDSRVTSVLFYSNSTFLSKVYVQNYNAEQEISFTVPNNATDVLIGTRVASGGIYTYNFSILKLEEL